jgi:hypothetical protein
MNNSYYIESPWDLQWIAANNHIVEHITSTNMEPTGIFKDHNIYDFEFVGEKYIILQASHSYVSTINRLTDFYYKVLVKINNMYVLAREHQRNALIKYVMTGNPNVSVPHMDGGDFKAVFKTIDKNNFEYTTEDGNTVEIQRIAVL